MAPSDGMPDDYFGSSLSIAADTVLVGASLETVNSNQLEGAAYVFVKSGGSDTRDSQADQFERKCIQSVWICSGQFTTFEAVGGGTATRMNAINASGQTTGWGNDGNGGTYGFLGNNSGTVSIFNIDQGTDGTAISDSGIIVGYGFSDGGDESFERQTDGTITILPIPFSNSGNVAVAINSAGDIVGYYTDSAGANHGWVSLP